jgi:hypothetical protein
MSVSGGRCERICKWAKVLTVLAVFFPATACTEGLLKKTASDDAGSKPVASKSVVSNPIARVAQAQGIQTCLPAIADVTTFIARGAPTGAHVFQNGERTDEKLFSVSLETDHPGATLYSSASFAPLGAGCSGTYDVVSYAEGNCAAVAGKQFPKLKPAGQIRDNITVYNLGPTARAFLMAAGSGCVTIRKVMFEGVQAKPE